MCSLRFLLIVIVGLSALSPWLATAEARPGKVRLVHRLQNPDEYFTGFSTNGRLLMGGRNHRGINYFRLWDPKADKDVARFIVGGYHMAFSPDGKIVAATFHEEKEIRLFDVPSGKQISRLRLSHLRQPADVLGLEFAPDGKTLLVAGNGCDGVRLWDIKTGIELWRLQLQLPEKSPHLLRERWGTSHRRAFSPDGKLLAVALEDSSIHLCDMRTGVEVRRLFRESRGGLSHLAFSPDGRYLAADAIEPSLKFVIRLWDVRSGELVRSFSEPDPPLLLPDDPVSVLRRQAEFLQDPVAASKKYAKYFVDSHSHNSDGLAFSPDGKTLGNACPWTQLWEVATGRLRHEFDAYTAAVCFSPDGRFFAGRCYGDDPKNPKGPAKWEGIFLWDWRDPCLEQPKRLGTRDIERLWSDLASADAHVGYQAIAILLAHPQHAVAALEKRLRRVEPVVAGEMDRLIAGLDDENFLIREKATTRLEALGELARPILLQAKSKRTSPEVRHRVEDLLARLARPTGGPEPLRCLRAVEVLETVGTEEARRVLAKLASGAEGAMQTEDAKAALKRLNHR